jgi:FlaA1/EpsC-like NDP-sugar epimerase
MSFNKIFKTVLISGSDLSCLIFAWLVAYLFRFDFDLLHTINLHHSFKSLIIVALVYLAMFFAFGMQRIIWRYVSIDDMLKLALSVFTGFVLSEIAIFSIFNFHYIPLSIIPLHAFFYLALVVASRVVYKLYRSSGVGVSESKRVLIIGAGAASAGLLRDMLSHHNREFKPIGLLDDNKALHRRALHGVRVLGGKNKLSECLHKMAIDLVIFAIPSLDNNKLLNDVVAECSNCNVAVRILPGLKHLTDGRVAVDSLREVSIEDLLGREPVISLNDTLSKVINEKIVLVTGGGGSIGSELCRQIAINRPAKLYVIDNCEFNLYQISRELTEFFPDINTVALLVDVSNKLEISRCIAAVRPSVIFHAAAYKHVPMLEYQVFSAVKNNILATINLANLADMYNVESFVLISTDKAVNPTNLMGVTKRIAEIYCQNINTRSKTSYVTVRFGNVLGSAGSVLPLFRDQLAKGGPLTVTDKRMTRFFMMIPEAVFLILQSFLIGKGGEIFVLDMGEPIKVVDLAEQLIKLSGKTPYTQVKINFTGIRAGEKLYEEIFHNSELLKKTANEKIFISNSRISNWSDISLAIENINKLYLDGDYAGLLKSMFELVPEYTGNYLNNTESIPSYN